MSLKKHRFSVDLRRVDLSALREYLQNRANLLLRLLENPILQERGHFADLRRAIFHLRDELLNKENLRNLIDTDRKHLEGDIVRIYKLLVFVWLAYMRYLNKNYGYHLSLAIRINPFDPESTAVVKNSCSK